MHGFPIYASFFPSYTQVVAVEQLLGIDCDEAAEDHRLAEIDAREKREGRRPPNGGDDLVAYYEQLEARVAHG
jgi:hypothetical protein